MMFIDRIYETQNLYTRIYNNTSIKRNILTIKQNTSGSNPGYGLISTPVQLGELKLNELFSEGNSVCPFAGILCGKCKASSYRHR